MDFIKKYIAAWWLELNTNPRLKSIRRLWKVTACIFAIIALFLLYLFIFEIPSFNQIENPDIKETTVIYDAKGRPYGSFYLENRLPVDYREINPLFVKALIATEDARFYQHWGIDFEALGRVLYKTILLGQEDAGGGSTISQQLAKLFFNRPKTKDKNIVYKTTVLVKSKIKEWIIALRLERRYTKEEIISMYLNKFEFINGAHGIQSASKIYYGKTQDQLNLNEVATLVGMLKNPSLFNPIRFKARTRERRDVVLGLMETQYGMKLDSIKKLNLDVSNFKRDDQTEGTAPYFRAELTKWVQEMLNEKNIRKVDGSLYNVFADGLKIYTTIDLDYQRHAEQAAKEHMTWLQDVFTGHWKGKDPWTYQADVAQLKVRQESLMRKVRESERYEALKNKYLDPIYNLLPKEIEIEDADLDQWLSSSGSKSNIFNKKLVAAINTYEKTPNYAKIKSAYSEFKDAYEKSFFTKIKMEIFDHAKGRKLVEMSPFDSVKYHGSIMQHAMLAIDPRTGEVKSWVGGIDFKYFKYDHVTARRAVGSVIKPFVYASAMVDKDIKPCDAYEDIPHTVSPGEGNFKLAQEWTPNNATENFTSNYYNLYQGLCYSKNSITVKLLKEMGTVDYLRDLLNDVGIDKDERLESGRLAVPEVPAICLGAVDITLYQMAGAYTAFANQGMFKAPFFVSMIKDADDRVIYTAKPYTNQAIDPLHNAVMVDMLKNVTSGDFALNVKSENGGKTGTTDDFVDGWFMCVTPSLVIGVWTGGDDKWVRFTNLDYGQGYVTARPAVERYIRRLENDKNNIYDYKLRFATPPSGFKELTACAKKKILAPAVERKLRLEGKITKATIPAGLLPKPDTTKRMPYKNLAGVSLFAKKDTLPLAKKSDQKSGIKKDTSGRGN